MIVKPKSRGFICLTAHPEGCYKNVEDMARRAAEAVSQKSAASRAKPKNVLVIGSSGGYGLASRIVAAFGYGAKTIGVAFDKEASKGRTATSGFYCTRAFDQLAEQRGIPSISINADAFSYVTKDEVTAAAKILFGGEKIDLMIYSVASPRRTDPSTGQVYNSVIKPLGEAYTNKTVDFHTGAVSEVTIEPASELEANETIKVMGGEDWELWIEHLARVNLIGDNFVTMAYSYIGPSLTHPIYRDGTIGAAKDDLNRACNEINMKLSGNDRRAYVSVNKGLVTQASSAIPVVPLYISLLYKVMKEKGIHEGCYEQMERLFTDKLYGVEPPADMLIRMDDLEMREDVQSEIDRLWPLITSETAADYLDLEGYREDFFSIFGFGRSDVDYDNDVEIE